MKSGAVPYVWMIVWQHPQGDWFPWEFEKARRKRSDLYAPLKAVREKYPDSTFRLRKFAMVKP